MIAPDEAIATATALRTAAETPGILRQIRYELEGRAVEWERAVSDCMEADGEACIELAASVTRGMRVFHDRFGWSLVLRKLNDGMSLHMETPDSPQGWYKNLLDSTSPVVVRA